MKTQAERKARLQEISRDSQRLKDSGVDADLKDVRSRKKRNKKLGELRNSPEYRRMLMLEQIRLERQKECSGRRFGSSAATAASPRRRGHSSEQILRGEAGTDMQNWLYAAIRAGEIGCTRNAERAYAALASRRGEVL